MSERPKQKRSWRFWTTCHRKVKYGHEDTARRSCEEMAQHGKVGLSEYKCHYCDGWHIGHRQSERDWIVLTRYNPKANYQKRAIKWVRDEDNFLIGKEVQAPVSRPRKVLGKKYKLENLVKFGEYLMKYEGIYTSEAK